MTRKNKDDIAQVIKILSTRALLADWNMVPIEGLSEPEVGRIMGESRLFLAFGHPKGSSLSNLEALACGCRLIGYSGRAGRDYFKETSCIEVEVGDVIGFCEAVEEFVQKEDAIADTHASVARQAARYVSEVYSNEAERNNLVSGLRFFLASADHASP